MQFLRRDQRLQLTHSCFISAVLPELRGCAGGPPLIFLPAASLCFSLRLRRVLML